MSSLKHIYLTVKTIEGKFWVIACKVSESVSKIKDRIKDKMGIDSERQILVFKGVQLQDTQKLEDCDVVDGATVHLVTRPGIARMPGGGPVPGGGAGNARMTISIAAAESFKLAAVNRTRFSIRATMPFRKLFDTYCELQALSLDSLCFNFGGKELTQTQTPADVEMPGGAVIDVVESPLINCKVTGMQGDSNVVYFLIPKSTPLKSLIEAYCARQRLDARYTRFTQRGEQMLSEAQSMGELGVKAGKILSFYARSLVVLAEGADALILFSLGEPVADGVEFLPAGHVRRLVLAPDVGQHDDETPGHGLALDLRGNTYTNLILKHHDRIWHVKMKRTTPMAALKEQFCIIFESLDFFFNGNQLRDSQSPEELGLSDNDVIKLERHGVIVLGQPDSGRKAIHGSVAPAIPSIDFIQIAAGDQDQELLSKFSRGLEKSYAASGDSEWQTHELITLSIRDEEMEERAKVKVHKRVQLKWVLGTLIHNLWCYGSLYKYKDPIEKIMMIMLRGRELQYVTAEGKPALGREVGEDEEKTDNSFFESTESGSRIRLLASQTLGELGQEGEIRLNLVSKFAPETVSAYFVRIENPNLNFVNETGSSMRQEFRIRDDATKAGQGAADFGIGFMPEHVNLKVMYSSKTYTDDVDSLDNQNARHFTMEKTEPLKALAEAFCKARRIEECFTSFAWKGTQVQLEATPMDLGMKHDDVLVASLVLIDLCTSDDKAGVDVEQTHERITLAVRDDRDVLLCHIKMYKKKTQLQELMDAICKRMGWQKQADIKFSTMWDCGSTINGLLTPKDYDLEDGDEIRAYSSKMPISSYPFAARLGVGWCPCACDWDEWKPQGDRVCVKDDATKIGEVEIFDKNADLDNVTWRGPYKVRFDDGTLSEWLRPQDLEKVDDTICEAGPLFSEKLRLKVLPFDETQDHNYQRKLKISAAGIIHEYPFVAASFGTCIDGDIQWNGDIAEYGNESRFGNRGTFALLKRGELSYVKAARQAQKAGFMALVVYNNADATINDLPSMEWDERDTAPVHHVDDPFFGHSKDDRCLITIPVIMISLDAGVEISGLLQKSDGKEPKVTAVLPGTVLKSRKMVLRVPCYKNIVPETSIEKESRCFAHSVDLTSEGLRAGVEEEFVRDVFDEHGLGSLREAVCKRLCLRERNRMNLQFKILESRGLTTFRPDYVSAFNTWVHNTLSPTQKSELEAVLGKLSSPFLQYKLQDHWRPMFEVQIRELPRDLLRLKHHVRFLHVGSSVLPCLPEWLGEMEAIEHLRVDGIEKGPSQLTKLPESLGSLKALKILMLNDCDVLLQLPSTFGRMSSVTTIYIENCGLITLPASFCNLLSLQFLKLENCDKLQKLPPDMDKLLALEWLCLNRMNGITELPASFAKLKSLKRLQLHTPKLSKLPANFGMLPLIILEVRDAALRELPLSFGNLANLEELILNQSESVLKDLPRSFGNLVRLKTLAIEISLVPAVEFAPQDVVAHLGFAPQKTKVYTTLGFALPNFQQLQFLKLDGNMIASEDEVVMLMRGLKAWPRQHFLDLNSNVHAWINLPDAFEIPERSHDANIATFMAQVGSWPEEDRGIHVISQKRCWLEMSPHYDVLNLPAETFGCGNVAVQQLLSINVLKIGALAAAMHPRLGQDSVAKSLSGDALKIIADFVTGCFTLAREFRKHADEMEVEST